MLAGFEYMYFYKSLMFKENDLNSFEYIILNEHG